MRVSVMIPDKDSEAPPMDIVCIIDISASMTNSAACKTDGRTEYEDLGYSILDLVKHAVKTVVKVMRATDRISIILFDHHVKVPFTFNVLTDNNRESILTFIDEIREGGATNIYDAITKGIDLIVSRKGKNLNDAAILFFTDGQPNEGKYIKTNDIIKGLKEYKKKKKFNFPIHSYAFG